MKAMTLKLIFFLVMPFGGLAQTGLPKSLIDASTIYSGLDTLKFYNVIQSYNILFISIPIYFNKFLTS